MRYRKWLRRAGMVLSNSFNSLVVPLLNIFVSIQVIRFTSTALWGEFVKILIVVQLSVNVIAWGNKEYLLRAFSRSPARIRENWLSNLIIRLSLYLAIAVFAIISGQAKPMVPILLLWGLALTLYQSTEVLVVFQKEFLIAGATEILGFGLMITAIQLAGSAITVEMLLVMYAAIATLKAGFLLTRFRRYTLPSPNLFPKLTPLLRFEYFGAALPFFLLSFSGMLNTRIDLYLVGILMRPDDLGRYQILINMLIYLQAIAALILTPYVKNLYRMEVVSIRRIANVLFRFGLFVAALGIPAIYFILTQFYNLNFNFYFFIIGFLYVVPIYYYLPTIYMLFRLEKQNIVLGVNIIGIALNTVLNLLLIPSIGLIGALVSTTLVRLLVLVFYTLQQRRILFMKSPELNTVES